MQKLIEMPDDFSKSLIERFGREAESWLEDIPNILSKKLDDWGLELKSSNPLHGAMGLVFFVSSCGEDLVLKISWFDNLTKSENAALKIWDGDGAVRLLDYDSSTHSSLMERLSSESLEDINIKQAGIEAGRLIKKLGVKSGYDFPKLAERLNDIDSSFAQCSLDLNGSDFDWEFINKLISRRRKGVDNLLSHGDIGYLNILKSKSGEWKAIDPKPMLGDLEFSVPELMWSRIDELKDNEIIEHLVRIVNSGNLDRKKAIEWTIIRAVDYYFWGMDNGLTEDPPRCLRLYRTLKKEIV